jgi:extracellular elastinolytic metalloproteinase
VPDNSGLVHYPENKTLTFVYPYNPTTGPARDGLEAGVTQIFYTVNMMHDLLYVLGFTPAAGNMQEDNYGEGGKPRDGVRILTQYWSGKNNGQMTQTVDGTTPEMTMLLFDKTDPDRDVAMDNGFVIHEYTHGLSGRLTGGPGNSGCLNAWEADGMAEGWSDLYAAAVMLKPEDKRDTAYYGFAAWPLNFANETARLKLYSTNREINNFTYSSANGRVKVHEVGTVWATMLYDLMWNLIDRHGKNDAPRPTIVNGVPTDGKYMTMKILMDAMAL